MAMYYNGKKVRNLYYNGKCITRLTLGKEMTRLVEGDDFVRAEWLNSVSGGEYISLALGSNTDSNAYIRTTYKCNYNSRYFDISIGGSRNVSNNWSIRIFNINSTTFIDVHKWTNGTQTSYRKQVSGGSSGVERSLYVTLTNWQVDNQSGTVTLGTAFDTDYNYQATELRFPNSSYAYKRTQMRTYNREFDLVPCRLLRPIPASLDANGIARNAGECGMYDAVSGKFYGNVANSGAFTVEPSLVDGVDYERHKWLKGDGSAYLYLGEVQNYIEFDVDLQQEVKTDVFIYGLNGQIRYQNNGQTLSVLAPENRIKYYNVPLQGTIRIDFSTHYVYFNGEQFGHTDLGTVTDLNDENCYKKAYFFGFEQLPSFRSRYVSLGKVNMDGSNLTPVRLLRPLPSYLDANGKARKQFECGMLDLKTMKFYGNMNTSGKFTVSDN